jgi:hypothetical protein
MNWKLSNRLTSDVVKIMDTCFRIETMLKHLHELGANTEKFELKLNELCLEIARFKACYERNEFN